MRGTRLPCKLLSIGNGIIPAYAGNTTYWKLHELYVRDHPRVCGEHDAVNWPNFAFAGSSPRMRGTLPSIGFTGELVGIIPAYAGNTSICTSRGVMRGDHPRVCGEHVLTEVDG